MYQSQTSDFAKFISDVWWLIGYEGKWGQTEEKLILKFQETKENCDIDFQQKVIEIDFKNIYPCLNFSQTRILPSMFNECVIWP